MLHSWRKYGTESASNHYFEAVDQSNRPPGKNKPKYGEIVRGKIQFLGNVKGRDDPVYIGLARSLALRDPTFSFNATRHTSGSAELSIYCEGATDTVHLRAAFSRLRSQTKFSDLKLHFKDGGNGGDALLKRCKQLARDEQANPCVFVFDRDGRRIIKEVTGDDEIVKDWGNRVCSFAIPVPKHREERESTCIELYYKDDDLLKKDADGRRLFLRSEFDDRGFHKTEQLVLQNPQDKSLISERVMDGQAKRNVALSKTKYAKLIEVQTAPFDVIDFSAFETIFEILDCIASRARTD
ncbi:MAG: hypothetical protein ACREBC_15540 [Pyrinomonadaceae bacterium]